MNNSKVLLEQKKLLEEIEILAKRKNSARV